MERFGIFVDAGYVYASAGLLLFGVKERKRINFDSGPFLAALQERGCESCGQMHLRTYWYDGARDGTPTPQQSEIANLPGIKLRLGRLTQHGQKGVDSRIVRDLIILSTERAISTVYLLGGDEDLREGVAEAQERGVRVVLVGITPVGVGNLSPTLVMEADDVDMLDREFVEPFFKLRDPEVVEVAEPENPHDPRELGRAFGGRWKERNEGDLNSVLGSHPRIPPDVDCLLLAYASQSLNVRTLDDETRKILRLGFWEALD